MTPVTPDALDWRKKGAVTPVKYQGNCGGCFAFSAIGAVEGAWAVAGNDLVELSEQQIISCCSNTNGCSGGDPGDALKCLVAAGGVASEEAYPYVNNASIKALKCDHKLAANATAKVKSYSMVSDDASTEFKVSQALAAAGPLSVSINAQSLQDYKSGVDNPSASDCPAWLLTHALTLVGYGTEETGTEREEGGGSGGSGGGGGGKSRQDYYVLKNSFGKDWGEDGYYRLSKGKNTCGIATDVYSVEV